MAKSAKPKKPAARKNPITDQPDDAPIAGDPYREIGMNQPHLNAPPAGPAFPLSELETWTAARVFFAARQELHQHQHQPWVAVAGDHQAKFVESFKEKWAEIQAGGKSKLLEDWLLVGIVETMVAWGQEHG